jgi:hypothetical protein
MKTFIIILTILALAQGAFAQTDKQINDINKTVLGIKNDNPKGTPGGNIGADDTINNVIRSDDKVVYVSWARKDNNIIKKDEYFFSNDLLIFYEETWTDNALNIVNDQKYYISNSHILSWISNGKEMDKTSKDFKDMDNYFSKISNDWEKCKLNSKANK